jgi:hypothetical protein
MRLTAFFLLILFTFNSFAYTPKSEVAPENEKWNWTPFFRTEQNALIFVDFTKKETLAPNKYIVPIIYNIDYQYHRGYRYWILMDCSNMKTSMLGVHGDANLTRWSAGLVKFEEPRTLDETDPLSFATKMYCGIDSKIGKIYGYDIFIADFSFYWRGWVGEQIKLVTENNEQLLEVKFHVFKPDGTIRDDGGKALVRCDKKEVFQKEPNITTHFSSLFPNPSFVHLVDSLCSYYEAHKSNFALTSPSLKGLKPSMDMSMAKSKCLALGFKTGTEKFGSCVLELTK